MQIDPSHLPAGRLFWMTGAVIGGGLTLLVLLPFLLVLPPMLDDLSATRERMLSQTDLMQRADRMSANATRLQPWTANGANILPGRDRQEAQDALAALVLRQAGEVGLPPPTLANNAEEQDGRVVSVRLTLSARHRELFDFVRAMETSTPFLAIREMHLRPETDEGSRLNVELVVAGIRAGG